MQKFLLFIFILSSFFYFSRVQAQEVSFRSEVKELETGSLVTLEVWLENPDEPVNTVSGLVVFPKERLELVSLADSGSRISIWLEKTDLAEANQSGVFGFAGLSPEGIIGSGKILNLKFKALQTGEAVVENRDFKIFFADGSGKERILKNTQTFFTVKNSGREKPKPVTEKADTLLPEDFSPVLARNPDFFNNHWFVSFAARDADSGISHYEIAEVRGTALEKIPSDLWKTAVSPHILSDQTLTPEVYIKAVDNAGNERIVKLKYPEKSENYAKKRIFVIILSIAFLILLPVFFLRKKIGFICRNKNENF